MRILKQLYFSFKRIVHNVVIISEDFFMNIETLHKGCSWIFERWNNYVDYSTMLLSKEQNLIIVDNITVEVMEKKKKVIMN